MSAKKRKGASAASVVSLAPSDIDDDQLFDSLRIRKSTLKKLTQYKEDNSCSDYSSCIDKLLSVDMTFQNNKRETTNSSQETEKTNKKKTTIYRDSKAYKYFLLVFRLGLLALGIYLVTQFLFFLYFPSYQAAQKGESSKRVLFYGDPQIEGSARIKRQGVFGRNTFLYIHNTKQNHLFIYFYFFHSHVNMQV